MLICYNGVEVFFLQFNSNVIVDMLIHHSDSDYESIAILGSAVLGEMILGIGG